MGDFFQAIVDIDATAEQAPDLATAALGWLAGHGIVVVEKTDCTLGAGGYAPGPHYASAVTEPDPRLHSLRTNGLAVTTGRTVFPSSGAEHIVCPHCTATTPLIGDGREPRDAWEKVSAAIGTWCSDGTGAHRCTTCGRSAELNEWQWTPPWGFGYLGFTFWNWPPLRDDFVASLSRQLGHRTVRPYGKL